MRADLRQGAPMSNLSLLHSQRFLTRKWLHCTQLVVFLFLTAASAFAHAPAPDVAKKLEDLDKAVKSAQMAGDNAWMLTSSALVLMMTGPGLVLFYGVLVRRKN